MSDRLPEVVEKLAYSLGGWCGDCGPRDVDCDTCKRDARALAVEALATLLAHAGPDATHINLSTWGGVRATPSFVVNCSQDGEAWWESRVSDPNEPMGRPVRYDERIVVLTPTEAP